MKKILLSLSLALILSSCTLGGTEKMETSMPPSAATGTYETDLRDVSGKIKGSEEFQNCMNMNVPMCIQTAGMQLAQKEKSTEVCKELPTQDQRESCVYAITIMSAQEKDDISLCNTLTGTYASQCTISITRSRAMTQKDPKICESIPESDTQNPITSSRDDCMMSAIVANEQSAIEDCAAINNKQSQEMCKTMIRSRPKAQ